MQTPTQCCTEYDVRRGRVLFRRFNQKYSRQQHHSRKSAALMQLQVKANMWIDCCAGIHMCRRWLAWLQDL